MAAENRVPSPSSPATFLPPPCVTSHPTAGAFPPLQLSKCVSGTATTTHQNAVVMTAVTRLVTRVTVDGPVQLVRHARSDLLSSHRLDSSNTEVHEVTAVASEAETAVCPALEEVNVYSKYIWDEHLENLCGLGPLCALHVRCQRLHSLTFVRCCRATLEELAVADCRRLLEDAFAELCCLEKLRVLQLSDCRVEAWTIGSYVANLPHLESFLVNGREALQKYYS